MLLSVQIASNIIKEVNSVIPLKVNIMNAKGIIIASSDKLRIGSFHEGAYEIIKNQIDELIVHYDGEFDGALEGINYSLKLQNYIIGVLGITGKYKEISESALIIKRMTELLLENTYSVEQRQIRESVCNRYLAEWLHGDEKNITPEFVERGKVLGFDITIPRRILVCSLYRSNHQTDLSTMQVIEEAEGYLKRIVSNIDPLNLYYKSGSTLVCAVTTMDDAGVKALAIKLKNQIEKLFPTKLAIGIDSPSDHFTHIQTSLMHAQKANKSCMRTHKQDIKFYNDLNMEVFMDEISVISRYEFVKRIFKGFSDGEIRNCMNLLETFYDMEGSLKKTSEHLFIHKNTLQYRLRKIAERTGYDPRSIRHSSLFYIAIYFYRELYGSVKSS
ncbi:MAG: hypothetical protein GX352_03600 [Clostridiales bacterium]|nr:hypothetical protein [Clostridiales bacterium]